MMEIYALNRDYATKYLETLENATLEERAAATEAFGSESLPSILSRTEGSNKAVITITGPLSPKGPSPLARFFGFGGTGYAEIIEAADSLAADPSITDVDLAMDTPGGTVAGMDQARQALARLAKVKKVTAKNNGMIASAGYFIAMAADSIVAMSPLSVTGSIGVIQAGIDSSEAMSRAGLKRIKIVSSNAPNKQADPTTESGRKIHQDDIDAMERVFIKVVAEGRNTTEQDVIENFGKGGELIAQDPDPDKPDALSVGMIDAVANNVIIASDDTKGGDRVVPEIKQTKGAKMDLNQLKLEHGALFAEVVALGVTQGVTQERERCDAHLTMGKASGDMDLAVSCITDGSEHTAATNAKYMAASMDKTDKTNRADESEGDIDTEATADADSKDEALADAAAELLGVERNA